MGSHLLAGMPRTGRYRHVIALLGDSAGGGGTVGMATGSLADVADATMKASLAGLELARDDEGLACCVHLLVRVTQAARQEQFLIALEHAGVPTPAAISGLPDVPVIVDAVDYTVYDMTAGFTAAVDRHLRLTRARTDVGELAQLAAAESLSAVCAERAESLYGQTTLTVQAALRRLSGRAGFAGLAHDFFARFTRRYLEYHLSRELSNHVGVGRRFTNVDEHNEFLRQLGDHCRVATFTVRRFAGEWYSKHVYLRDMGLETARRFAAHALDKVRDGLAYQEGYRND